MQTYLASLIRVEEVMNRWNIKDSWGFPGGSVVKNPPANAGDAGLIPGSGKSLKEKMATHSSIPAWKIPRTEGPGGL